MERKMIEKLYGLLWNKSTVGTLGFKEEVQDYLFENYITFTKEDVTIVIQTATFSFGGWDIRVIKYTTDIKEYIVICHHENVSCDTKDLLLKNMINVFKGLDYE